MDREERVDSETRGHNVITVLRQLDPSGPLDQAHPAHCVRGSVSDDEPDLVSCDKPHDQSDGKSYY